MIEIILLAGLNCAAAPERGNFDAIIAIVNSDIIMESDIQEALLPFFLQEPEVQGEELEKKLAELRQNVIRQLIQEKMMYQEAQRQNIKVQDAHIEGKIKMFESEAGGTEEFEKNLKAQGWTKKRFKKRLKEQTAIRIIFDKEVVGKAIVTPKEIKDFYDQHPEFFKKNEEVYLRKITLRKEENQTEDSFNKTAEEVSSLLRQGEDFSEVAKKYSKDAFAKEGGSVGWIEKGKMLKEIEDIVFSLKQEQTSNPIKINSNYYIFKVEDHRPGYAILFEEAQDKIRMTLEKEKIQDRFSEFIGELLAQSYITVKEK